MNTFRIRLRVRCKPRLAGKPTWFIMVQQRDYNGRYGDSDFRSWRKFSVWPLGFDSAAKAQAHMEACFTFANMAGRKMSASVNRKCPV